MAIWRSPAFIGPLAFDCSDKRSFLPWLGFCQSRQQPGGQDGDDRKTASNSIKVKAALRPPLLKNILRFMCPAYYGALIVSTCLLWQCTMRIRTRPPICSGRHPGCHYGGTYLQVPLNYSRRSCDLIGFICPPGSPPLPALAASNQSSPVDNMTLKSSSFRGCDNFVRLCAFRCNRS